MPLMARSRLRALAVALGLGLAIVQYTREDGGEVRVLYPANHHRYAHEGLS